MGGQGDGLGGGYEVDRATELIDQLRRLTLAGTVADHSHFAEYGEQVAERIDRRGITGGQESELALLCAGHTSGDRSVDDGSARRRQDLRGLTRCVRADRRADHPGLVLYLPAGCSGINGVEQLLS